MDFKGLVKSEPEMDYSDKLLYIVIFMYAFNKISKMLTLRNLVFI